MVDKELFGNSEQLDTIRRAAAIDALADYIHNVDRVYSTGKLTHDDCMDAARYVVGKLPSAYDNICEMPSAQRWIPCSERLPEEYGEYRITWTTSASKKRFVGDAEYEVTDEWDDKRNDFKGEWLLDDYIKAYPDVKVIAWKPIEEPYAER